MSSGFYYKYLWFREPAHDGVEVDFLCEKMVYSGRSKFQQIDVVDTRGHGRMLFLDGIAQSAESDEFIYHELLAHPPLFSHPEPRSVLVIGGAEGATLREIFRHPGIERVVMVDIDEELVKVCKEHLASWHQGSYDDPRLELVIGDGRRFVETTRETFDAMVIDLSDPLEDGPAVFLFTREFYQLLREKLKPGGSISVQGEGISPLDLSLHARMVNTLRSVFPVVLPYPYSIYSFHRPDAHILASTDPQWSLDAYVRRIENSHLPLLYLSAEVAQGMFILPPYLLQAYETHKQILTDEACHLEKRR